MNPPRFRPAWWAVVSGACALLLTAAAVFSALAGSLGRRSDEDHAPLSDALRAAAGLEALRMHAAVEEQHRRVDQFLTEVLRGVATVVDLDAAVPWVPGGCAAAAPAGVIRAGVMHMVQHKPLQLLEYSAGSTCSDPLGLLAVQALTGPPYPNPREVARTAQQAMVGVDSAVEGRTLLVSLWRDGVRAVGRLARADADMVAFADVVFSSLPPPPAFAGVTLHSLVMVSGLEAGYVHGGPDVAGLGRALSSVKAGEARALDLPALAGQVSAAAPLARLYPEQDDGSLALGAAAVPLAAAMPEVSLWIIAAAPFPPALAAVRWRVAGALALGLTMLVAVLLLSLRRVNRALSGLALDVRAAWLNLREDDRGTPAEAERASELAQALADRAQQALHAAFSRAERFWSPAPVARLMDVLTRRRPGSTPDDGKAPDRG